MSNMEMNVVASIEIKFVLRLRRKLDEIVRKMMKKTNCTTKDEKLI